MNVLWRALAAVALLAATGLAQAECSEARALVDQAFNRNVRERADLLEQAAQACPTFSIIESLGETYQAREEWDRAQDTYAKAESHLDSGTVERDHQQSLLWYRYAQVAMGRHDTCRAVAFFRQAAAHFQGQEQQQADAEMLRAESELTKDGVSASTITCSLSSQLSTAKTGLKLFRDASVDVPVQFNTDSAALTPVADNQVRQIAAGTASFVQQGYGLRVVGHTDKRGTREHNYHLSRERAQAVAESLARILNLKPAQIEIDGKGFDELKYQGDTAEVHRLNRRVEVALQPRSADAGEH